jgi:probable F420-dependent oxidoreductase
VKVRFAVAPPTGPFDADGLTSFALAAEELGFGTIWLSDVPMAPIGDPLLSLANLASRTNRLKLGANIVPIGRNPLILARQLAQLDRLSHRRLLISFVPGVDQAGERAALGLPTGNRWTAVEQDVGLLRRWWSGQPVDHHDRRYEFDGITVGPTPIQDPLEIWFGGAGPRALERVGRSADGWLTANMTPSEAATGRQRVLRHAEAAGRAIDPEHFGISIPYARHAVPADAAATLRARRGKGDLTGIVPVGATELVDLVERHVDAGLSKFVLRPVDQPDDATAQLAWGRRHPPASDLTTPSVPPRSPGAGRAVRLEGPGRQAPVGAGPAARRCRS